MVAPFGQSPFGKRNRRRVLIERNHVCPLGEKRRRVSSASQRTVYNHASGRRREKFHRFREEHCVVVFVANRFHEISRGSDNGFGSNGGETHSCTCLPTLRVSERR